MRDYTMVSKLKRRALIAFLRVNLICNFLAQGFFAQP
jgi:hypothetical protein